MFSKGTFLRYLYEVDTTHQEISQTYHRLVEQVKDPTTRDLLARLVAEMDQDAELVNQMKQSLTSAG